MISVEIEGLNEVLMAFERYGDVGVKEAAKAARATGEKVRSDAIKSIQRGPKTGELYSRGGGQNLSETHRASAAGEPPATDTGALVSNSTIKQDGVEVTIAFNQEYASWLEDGTVNMEPRPFIAPAIEKNRGFMLSKLKQGFEKARAAYYR